MKVFFRRFNSRFSYQFSGRGKRNKFPLGWIIFICIILYIVYIFNHNFMPVALDIARNKTNRIGTRMVNQAIVDRLEKDGIEYGSLYEIQKNESGAVTAVTTNVIEMNRLKAQLALDIQDKLERIDSDLIGIPLGSIYNITILAGRGPRIPVRLFITGKIEMDFESTYVSAGINQTKNSVSILTKVTVSSVLPGGSTKSEIVTRVPVAETIIVGNTPNTYLNIDGVAKSAPNTILNLLP